MNIIKHISIHTHAEYIFRLSCRLWDLDPETNKHYEKDISWTLYDLEKELKKTLKEVHRLQKEEKEK